jgi:hypothetical protein
MQKIYKPLLFLMVFTLILGGMYWKSVQDIPNPISKSVDPNPATQEISKVSENLIPTEELTQKPNSSTNSQEKSTTNNIGRKKRNINAPTQSSPINSKPNGDPNCDKCKALKKLIKGEGNQTLTNHYKKNLNAHPAHTKY